MSKMREGKSVWVCPYCNIECWGYSSDKEKHLKKCKKKKREKGYEVN